MGLGGISIWQLLIILAIVVMLFGTKRLRNIGGDLGEAIKGFKNSVSDNNNDNGNDINKDAADQSLNNTDANAEKPDQEK